MKYTICMFCGSSLPHITSLTNWSIIGDKKTQQSLDYSIQMFIPFSWFQGKLLFSLKKLSSSLFDDTDWFQWKSIPFKVQNSTTTVTMVEVPVYCFFETTLSLTPHSFAQVGGVLFSYYSSSSLWLILSRCHRCPDVADVLMLPMSRCRRTQDFPQVSCLPPTAPAMSLISGSKFPTDSARPSNRPATWGNLLRYVPSSILRWKFLIVLHCCSLIWI